MSRRSSFLFAVFIIFLSSFIVFSYFVHREIFNQFDFDTTVRFQNHISRRFDLPFSILSLLGSFEITFLVWFGILLFFLKKRYWLLGLGLGSFVVGQVIELFGKTFVYHPSPPFLFFRGALGFHFPVSYIHTDFSYPSGHVYRTTFLILFLILFLSFGRVSKKYVYTALFSIFLFLMLISRIYLGEHWTTDVIGGFLLGASIAAFCAVFIPNKTSS